MLYKIKNEEHNINAATIVLEDNDIKVFYSVITAADPSISEKDILSIYDEADNYMYKVWIENGQVIRQP